ncbi:thyroid hormone receptor interactor 12, variant 2 [Neurospora intermedia]|uniref:HECT-type E3 ubiquitin transferase n=1 Tax=Neurospora intermedia TaxID=5142 RepID=A0ABR3DAQ8_NEUIN
MSIRLTRSAARQAASQAANLNNSTSTAAAAPQPATGGTTSFAAEASSAPPAAAQTLARSSSAKKRKTTAAAEANSLPKTAAEFPSSARRSKRQRVTRPASQSSSSITHPAQPAAAPSSAASSTTKKTATTRRKKGKALATSTMSSPENSAVPPNPPTNPSSASTSRRSSRHKKDAQGEQGVSDMSDVTLPPMHIHSTNPASASASSRKSKRNAKSSSADQDVVMTGTDEHEKDPTPPPPPPPPPKESPPTDSDEHDEDDEDDDDHHRYDDDDDDDEDDDPFTGFGGHERHPHSLQDTLRHLSGIMSGVSAQVRKIMADLKRKDDPSMQLMALHELSTLLLMTNEDQLSGHLQPDQVVPELVALMRPNEITGEENPEIQLVACRCLANLMEALPGSTSALVYGGAVHILCEKLLQISFIDLAEQALSTLEKISVEYPTSVMREGGLTACLTYLDFFATSTQRSAVTTAANCCRNIPEDSFPEILGVMPILLNVLGSSDQRIVEQASLCVSRIAESFKYHPTKLEELMNVDLLKAILRLLLPGSTNLISPHIHTQFLRVLALTAMASPRLSAELFKLNVVETLYQILTGVSPPSGNDDLASKLDSVLIMQALIHRPRDQIIETLNVICELLPSVPLRDPSSINYTVELGTFAGPVGGSGESTRRRTANEKRIEHMEGCKEEVRRFALILFPTLTDAFSSTVNLTVRQKVLAAQLKMLSNLDQDILSEALRSVPYASFLASILSQQDHPLLVGLALQATELLMSRLDTVYRYQLYREGVIAEITKLAADAPEPKRKHSLTEQEVKEETSVSGRPSAPDQGVADKEHPKTLEEDEADDEDVEHSEHESGAEEGGEELDEDEPEDTENDENDENDDGNENEVKDDDQSPVSSEGETMSLDGPPRYLSDFPTNTYKSSIRQAAKKFLEMYETEKQGKAMKKKASKILASLSDLATEIEEFYLCRKPGGPVMEHGTLLFQKLVSYFDTDVLESVTSAELLGSGVVRVLEQVFSNPDEEMAAAAQNAFLQVFMGYSVKSKPKTATADSPATPFSVLIHKLQDLLSRSEHFEVITAHHNSFDGSRSTAASMLAKQIRLKLVADEDSDIPRSYRNIMVSIHAITTFKSLDDYLRPRISLSDRPHGASRRDAVTRALAAMGASGFMGAAAAAARLAERGLPPSSRSTPAPPPAAAPAQASGSRSSRKHKSKSQPTTETPTTPDASTSKEKGGLRRSARKQAASDSSLPRQPPEEDDLENALECADERQLSDDEDEAADSSDLNVLRDLDESMDDAPTPDPTAVNMEVAAGGRITARKEDGTRVATPGQGKPAPPPQNRTSALTAGLQNTPTPQAASRPMSYSGALQAVPQDWHIEFSVDGKVIPNETTIYRAVHSSSLTADEHVTRSIWSAVHPIKFRRVPGPPPPEPVGFSPSSDVGVEADENGTPGSLAKHPITLSILRLLKRLHDLNANIDEVLVENRETLKLNVEPLSQFVNTKLTAKLNRQLEEPLIVASNCLPSWSEDVARLYPFLFPFETRHLFLQSTSFGYARSMARWNAQSQEERRNGRDDRPYLGRLQRQKVRISRSKILESAVKVMELYGASQSILEVEYFEEVGTGLGPTLEFYSTVSKEFSKRKLKLWRDNELNGDDDFVSGSTGLFPRPLSDEFASSEEGEKILQLFKVLGKFVARSMIDSRIIDINFNPLFFRVGDSTATRPTLATIKSVDPVVARSLMTIKKFSLAKKEIDEDPNRSAVQKVADTENITIDNFKIDDLYLDFTLPGYPEVELVSNGSQTRLTIENVDLYLEKVIDMTLGSGVRRQIEAFRSGFSQVFPYSALSSFTPDELCTLFGRVDEDWSLETLNDSIKADHGYNMDSKSVRNLLQIMSELTLAERRDFLQFTTGSPKLPIGGKQHVYLLWLVRVMANSDMTGFKSLNPMFTVVCKPSEAPYTSDDYLPSVMTCVNYLKLPDYSDIGVLKKQLFTAMKEGQGAFHLS